MSFNRRDDFYVRQVSRIHFLSVSLPCAAPTSTPLSAECNTIFPISSLLPRGSFALPFLSHPSSPDRQLVTHVFRRKKRLKKLLTLLGLFSFYFTGLVRLSTSVGHGKRESVEFVEHILVAGYPAYGQTATKQLRENF